MLGQVGGEACLALVGDGLEPLARAEMADAEEGFEVVLGDIHQEEDQLKGEMEHHSGQVRDGQGEQPQADQVVAHTRGGIAAGAVDADDLDVGDVADGKL